MRGVVLWQDPSQNKAVIWCEDQGKLAFYSQPDTSTHCGSEIGEGDLIQFDVQDGVTYRSARNLQRLDVAHAPALASKLKSVAGEIGASKSSPKPKVFGSNVIAFPVPA